jgi:putative glutamine amidotransferase
MYHHSRSHKHRPELPNVRRPPIVAVTGTTDEVKGSAKVRVNRAYTDAIRAAGLIPLVVPPMTGAEAVSVLDAVHGLVLTGGGDIDPVLFGAARHSATGPANELRDECELALAREAAARKLPTLAICRGIQVLNVALGGTLVQDIPSQVTTTIRHDADTERNARVHDVAVDPRSRLGAIVGAERITTNSFHHQSIEKLATSLRTVATAPDQVIEGVECADGAWWAVGVQWHPEELIRTSEDWDRKLFSAFADAVRGQSPVSDPGL